MACAILSNADDSKSALYCTTAEWAFGPTFECERAAELFVEWLDEDPRRYSQEAIAELYESWRECHGRCSYCDQFEALDEGLCEECRDHRCGHCREVTYDGLDSDRLCKSCSQGKELWVMSQDGPRCINR